MSWLQIPSPDPTVIQRLVLDRQGVVYELIHKQIPSGEHVELLTGPPGGPRVSLRAMRGRDLNQMIAAWKAWCEHV